MLRKLPGDTTREVVSTVPDTAVVFRPTVLQTPITLVALVGLWRILVSLITTVIRHPIASVIALGVVVLLLRYGWLATLITIANVALTLTVWAFTERSSFCRWVGWRLLAWWRTIWVYRRHWQPVMVVSGLARQIKGREYLPARGRVRCDGYADTVRVKMLAGQSAHDWITHASNLSHGFGAISCRVQVAKPGWLTLTFPRRAMSDPLASAVAPADIPRKVDLTAVEVGTCENGTPLRLRVHGTHILIAGATGSGKGSWLWSIIRGLLPAVRAGLVEIWGLDPKLMELSYGRELFHRYAATPEDCVNLLEQAVEAMQERAASYAGRLRKHTPTSDDPFVLVVVDEVAFLTAYQPVKALRDRTRAALAILTTQGRAVGFGVVAASQDPRKEIINIRNLFPDKIALRLDESEQVDMVLGEGARDRGALADRISPIEAIGAGIGYVRLETSPDPIRARAGHVCDSDIRAMAEEYASGKGRADHE